MSLTPQKYNTASSWGNCVSQCDRVSGVYGTDGNGRQCIGVGPGGADCQPVGCPDPAGMTPTPIRQMAPRQDDVRDAEAGLRFWPGVYL